MLSADTWYKNNVFQVRTVDQSKEDKNDIRKFSQVRDQEVSSMRSQSLSALPRFGLEMD